MMWRIISVFTAGAVKIVKGHKKSFFFLILSLYFIAIYRYLIVCSTHLCPCRTECFFPLLQTRERKNVTMGTLHRCFIWPLRKVCLCMWFELHFDPRITRFEPRKMVSIQVFTSPCFCTVVLKLAYLPFNLSIILTSKARKKARIICSLHIRLNLCACVYVAEKKFVHTWSEKLLCIIRCLLLLFLFVIKRLYRNTRVSVSNLNKPTSVFVYLTFALASPERERGKKYFPSALVSQFSPTSFQ